MDELKTKKARLLQDITAAQQLMQVTHIITNEALHADVH